MTISDLEEMIARKLGELSLIPPGFKVQVELQGNNRRKKRSASADNWHPTRGDIGIFRLEPLDEKQNAAAVERQRQEIKQFLVVLQAQPTHPTPK